MAAASLARLRWCLVADQEDPTWALEIASAATPEPWVAEKVYDSRYSLIRPIGADADEIMEYEDEPIVCLREDAEFIAAARSLVPQLCDMVEQARTIAVELEQQLGGIAGLHYRHADAGDWCAECQLVWPCRTARTLGVTE